MSAPGLSWDALLKTTKIKLALIPDPDMYAKRSVISYISNRYGKSNNKYLKSYDPKQESKHIIYLDANYLYGFAMSKFLPTSEFRCIDPKELDLIKYTSSSSKGCVLEVDLECPKELWELQNDYLLYRDKMQIKKEMVSAYKLKITDLYNIPIGNVKRYCLTFLIKKSM